MRQLAKECLGVWLLAAAVFAAAARAGSAQDPSGLEGAWECRIDVPGREQPIELELLLEPGEGGVLRGSAALADDQSPILGTWRAAEAQIAFDADFGDEEITRFALARTAAGDLQGTARRGAREAKVQGRRQEAPLRFWHDRGFDLPAERPASRVSSLEPALAEALGSLLVADAAARGALGASMAVVRDGEIALQQFYGFEDVDRRIATSGETRYRWASISKVLTAVAALQLAAAGKLDLDADVRDLVPEFPAKEHRITARHLLCHQSGIPHYEWHGRGADDAGAVAALGRFAAAPLRAEPGRHYHYTTYGYVLLGAVVERAAARPFAAHVKASVLDVLGMATMQPDAVGSEIPHRARGYRSSRLGLGALDRFEEVEWKLAGGGWISSVGDLARFGIGLMGDALLDRAMRAEMATTRIPADGRDPGYGYGIGVRELAGETVLSHSGSQSATRTFLAVCPARRAGVFVMSNTRNYDPSRPALAVLGALLGE